MTGSELAASGDWDGSARTAAGSGAGGAGVREEGVGSEAGLARSGSDFLAADLGAEAREEVGSGARLVGSGSDFSSSDSGFEAEGPDDGSDDGLGDFDDEYRVRPWWGRASTLVVFVVVLFVVSGGVTAWLRISDLQDRVDVLEAQTLAAEEARQVAVPLAEDLASYDYRDLGGNFRVVKASATPHFAEQLRQLSEELGPQLQQNRAVAKATVRSAGVVRATADSAVVALFVDQTVTNSKTATPRTERSRMELTLLKQGGVWRLDQAGEL